uniref:Uncharacterized protein n=1 Tax=Rhizophora mucronata TaxID=61149 RepID=A0A2P2PNE0_RHIMU
MIYIYIVQPTEKN